MCSDRRTGAYRKSFDVCAIASCTFQRTLPELKRSSERGAGASRHVASAGRQRSIIATP